MKLRQLRCVRGQRRRGIHAAGRRLHNLQTQIARALLRPETELRQRADPSHLPNRPRSAGLELLERGRDILRRVDAADSLRKLAEPPPTRPAAWTSCPGVT
jgi:hypothetical protein